ASTPRAKAISVAAGIVVLTQTHPIDVVFTLPESSIATVVQAQKAGKALSVEAWDRTNKQKISVGELLSLDNQIDATTVSEYDALHAIFKMVRKG
ncbi:hypothetical protein FK513_30530, partial [Klebsiella pneumoniae]|nr:hypothetical protein [Klebsiella pneumoniae]